MNKSKTSELILKLSLSGMPPSLQEYIISNIDKLQENNLDELIAILDGLAEAENDYLKKAEKYLDFYKKLSEDLKSKLIDEAKIIQEELLLELLRNK